MVVYLVQLLQSKLQMQLQKTHGIKIDKRKMELDEAIRSLGFTNVPVKLHQDVKATLKVHVTEEGKEGHQ